MTKDINIISTDGLTGILEKPDNESNYEFFEGVCEQQASLDSQDPWRGGRIDLTFLALELELELDYDPMEC